MPWQNFSKQAITAIEFNPIDRLFLLDQIAKHTEKQLYFWNLAYDSFQLVTLNQNINFTNTKLLVGDQVVKACQEVKNRGAVFVLEGLGRIDLDLGCQLKNFYFDFQIKGHAHQIILIDEVVQIPLSLYPFIPNLRYTTPNLAQIKQIIPQKNLELAQACIGLSRGEIELLLRGQTVSTQLVLDYKIKKLIKRGLKIVPEPDVPDVGGLENLERDLAKIKKLFSASEQSTVLSPPKGCLLWGLPGTGKSLVAKMMGKKLNAVLVSCDWNQLLDSDLATSLNNLQYVLDLVDSIGNCILFFDEFEKAFAGWNSEANGGILAKMAGKLLTWLQDHQSPSIMLATINYLDMLPPELIRRFQYIWFFNSQLHNGAMWQVFQLHLEKHFPGKHQQFTDNLWHQLFLNYRGCSPAEIAGAVERVHHELVFTDRHLEVTPALLLSELVEERARFKPASTSETTSNALSKILMLADFARPVQGKDTSRFAVSSAKLFEEDDSEIINIDEYTELFHKLVKRESNQQYSYAF
ncbi:MAG: ATP-binding protein [Waterburya sp.]